MIEFIFHTSFVGNEKKNCITISYLYNVLDIKYFVDHSSKFCLTLLLVIVDTTPLTTLTTKPTTLKSRTTCTTTSIPPWQPNRQPQYLKKESTVRHVTYFIIKGSFRD